MDLKEAIDRIEFEIEEDLRDKSFTIAGRMDIERIKQAKNELNTLNKGIDELIKKYEDKISETLTNEFLEDEMWKYDNDRKIYKQLIQDLKKLKGE